ncbi:unnamed protein product [Absidia cylindrospora]
MCDLSDPRITQTYQAIIEGEPTDWLLLGYNDTRDVISLYSQGTNGLSEFRSQLQEEILFGFVRVEDCFILISYVPDQVSGVRRARTLVHSRSVASLFQVHHAQLTASTLNDLSDANIRTRLKLGENQVPNRSRPNSLSERKRSSLQARRKSQQQQPSSSDRPSLPSSPTTSSYTAEPDTFEEAREDFSTPSLDTTPTPASLSDITPTSTSTVDANEYQDNNDNHHDQSSNVEHQSRDNEESDKQQRQKLEDEQQLAEQQRQQHEEQKRLAEQKHLDEQEKQRRIDEEQQRISIEKHAAEQRAAEQQRRIQEEQAQKQAKEKEEQRRLALEKEREEKQRLLQKQLQQAEKTKDVIIQGFSNIQTSTSPFWRRRYFIVRGKNLALYRDHDTPTPITIIDLKSVSKLRWADMEIDTFVPNAFMLDMKDGGAYQIFADHQQDATTIFTALQTVIQSK